MAARTVLITGSARGIGLTLTKHYVKEGWKVIAAARNPTATQQLTEEGVYKVVSIDVADEDSVLRAAKELEGESVDLLINNAGILDRGGLEEATKASMMKQFEVNAVGPFLMARAFRSQLQAAVAQHGVAKVVNISSILGSVANASAGSLYGYNASKAALNMVSASLAKDLEPAGIVALAVHPGYVASDMNAYKGVVSQEDSVAGLTKVFANATMDQSGKFFDFKGEALPW